MDEVTVDVELGEGARVAPLLQDKLAGGQQRALLMAMVGMIVGLVVVPMLGTLIPYFWARLSGAPIRPPGATYWGWLTLIQIGAAITGWEIGGRLDQRRRQRRYLDALAARGTPRRITTTFRLLDDGLHVATERASHVAAWRSVLQVEPAETHWLIQTDTLTVALPKRAFASDADERAFLARLLGRMDRDARARSGAAEAFAAGAG